MSKVLIVVDMQNDFIDGSLGTKEAVEIVDNVVAEINKDYDLVICTRDTHHEDYLNTSEGRHLPVVHCQENTEGWQIRKEVAEAVEKKANKLYLNKGTFGSPELVDIMKKYADENPLESITLIGLCTDICVVNNALLLKPCFPEVEMRVIADCCAGVTPESHDAALTTMKMCQLEII